MTYVHGHYNDVIMGAIASQITSLTIVYLIVYQTQIKENIKLRVTSLCEGNSPGTGEFPTQIASNAESSFNLMTSSCFCVFSLLLVSLSRLVVWYGLCSHHGVFFRVASVTFGKVGHYLANKKHNSIRIVWLILSIYSIWVCNAENDISWKFNIKIPKPTNIL